MTLQILEASHLLSNCRKIHPLINEDPGINFCLVSELHTSACKIAYIQCFVLIRCYRILEQLGNCDLVLRLQKYIIVYRLSIVDWGCHSGGCIVDHMVGRFPLQQHACHHNSFWWLLVVTRLSLWQPVVSFIQQFLYLLSDSDILHNR